MAVALTGSGGLFTRLGKLIHAINTANTARGTTVPTEIQDAIIALEAGSPSLAILATGSRLTDAATQFDTGSGGCFSLLKDYAQKLVVQMVYEDQPQSTLGLNDALIELVRQMDATSDSVDAPAIAITPTAGSGNVGNGAVVTSTKRGDGLVNELIYGELVTLFVQNNDTPGSESIVILGEVAITDKLAAQWPGGSGATQTLTVVDAAISGGLNLLTNSSFDLETVTTNAPDDWIVVLGTIGTTLKLTDVEVQTVVISGTPTSGTYRLLYTNAASQVQITTALNYNATGSEVQSALRALAGLEQVEVVTTGTDPNYTHTITFNGVSGNVTELTSSSLLDTGSIAHATTTAGSTNSFANGKALEFDSNGSQLTCIQQPVSLNPLTQYAFNCWMKTDSIPAAGVLRISLWDGNAVINDEQGNANSLSITASALTTSFVAKNVTFRTPKTLPPAVYLRIEITTAVSNTSSIFTDHAALTTMLELYPGGPSVAVFGGSIPFSTGDEQNLADNWELSITNDRAGGFQDGFDRLFDMAQKGLLLPSNSGGTETINDNLIG